MSTPVQADPQACRVAIVGASSLRGRELRQFLEDRSFPATDMRLLDEEFAAGTLTEAAGEPAVIQPVDEGSFHNVRFTFFAGSADFAASRAPAAQRMGTTVIDLTGGLSDILGARPWIPKLDSLLPSPEAGAPPSHVYLAPSAPAIVATTLAAALASFGVQSLAFLFFQPVSAHDRAGIDELESQTVKLLSFQPIAQEVFGAQAAFNMLSRYGDGQAERLSDARNSITRDVRRYLAGRVPVPAVQLVHAPVFHSAAFSAYGHFPAAVRSAEIESALERTGAKFPASGEEPPSNLSAAGSADILLARVEHDPSVPNGLWFWGAVDNLRLAAANAFDIAERLLAS